ncbi:M15 family metallopeptidase [Synechococcus sp. N19]|uniref:M15 family metallopeptidase n=1 Tax=Synechococcus sp. N19 TaxID=2575512 RepID=UPI0010BE36CD|nr:M15 family metallopeptidase [Synechococcus sp. N19]
MGPTLATSIAVRTGIEPGSRPWTARSVRVPFAQLCRSMQSMHNRGLAIDLVAFSYGSGEASAPAPAAAPVAAVTEEAPKADKKPAKRGGRRKRG